MGVRKLFICSGLLILSASIGNRAYGASSAEDFQLGPLSSDEGRAIVTYDWDNDGDQDYLIGAPLSNAGGTFSGRIVLKSQHDDPAPIAGVLSKNGGAPFDLFGSAIALLPDLNCDSYPEVLVSAPNGNSTQGVAYVINVRAVMAGNSGVLATITPHVAGGNLAFGAGFAVLSNNKIAISAPKANQFRGRVEIWSISASSCSQVNATWLNTLEGSTLGADIGAEFGSCITALSNVDNGTEIDLGVGARNWSSPDLGRVLVFRGENFSQWGQAIVPAATTANQDGEFGFSCADAGDSDKNGTSDIAIGAPFQNSTMIDSGKVYVFASPSSASGAWSNLGTLGVDCDRCEQGSAVTGVLSSNPNDPMGILYGMRSLGLTDHIGGEVLVNNDSTLPGQEFGLADLRYGLGLERQSGSYVVQVGDINSNGKPDDYVSYGPGKDNAAPNPDSPPAFWTYGLGTPLSVFTGAYDNNIPGGACPGLGSITPSIDQLSTDPSGLPIIVGCQTQNCSPTPSPGQPRCCQAGEIPGCAFPSVDPNCSQTGHAPCCAGARIFGSGFEPTSPTSSTYNVAICAVGGSNGVFNPGLPPGCHIDVWPIGMQTFPINSNGDIVDPNVIAPGPNPYANSTATGVNLFYYSPGLNTTPGKIQCVGTHASFSGPMSNPTVNYGGFNQWQISNWIDLAISY